MLREMTWPLLSRSSSALGSWCKSLSTDHLMLLFANEWGQYLDLLKGLMVSDDCNRHLRPLHTQVTTLWNLTALSTVLVYCDMEESFRPAIRCFRVRSFILLGVGICVCIKQMDLGLTGHNMKVHTLADATSFRSMMVLALSVLFHPAW